MNARIIALWAGLALAPVIGASPAQKPRVVTNASVKLWLDTAAGNACEQSRPASGDWTIRNNEDRNVRVTIRRTVTKDGTSREDEMRDTLGPRESRELGCETTDNSHQSLTLVRAIY